METNELMEIISEHLQKVNSDTTERLKRIDEMLFFINFNRRLTELTDEERVDYTMSHEGYPWTENMRKTYDNARDQETKDHYIDMWARSRYIRQCAWDDYLAGYANKKPTLQKTETQAA